MSDGRDRRLGMDRPITRRDFLNGVAIGAGGLAAGGWLAACHPLAGAGTAQSASEAQNAAGYYPPTLTGLRGSHPGSYDVGHALANGSYWKTAGTPVATGERYDLVIVGAGISGLAAAHFFLARQPSARILILDNHDDVGGHAKRNEFHPRGRLLLSNGGTYAIESPFPYSPEARGVMTALGIDPVALQARCAEPHVYDGLGGAVFFDRETFGRDALATGEPGRRGASSASLADWTAFLRTTPLSAAAQQDIARIQAVPTDYWPGVSSDVQKDRLSRMSYRDFLLHVVGAHPDVVPYYQTATHGLYGVGIDAVPALDCWAIELPGFGGMRLEPGAKGGRLSFTALGAAMPDQPPYFFHFPDGNASIVRLLVRRLIPAAMPGHTVDDVVTARLDYGALDHAASPVRLRLNSTVIRVRHDGPPATASSVEVTYGRPGAAYTVHAGQVVMACWNMMIPYLCPELPAEQQTALHYGVKVPLCYTAVQIRDRSAFQRLGIRRITTPGMYHTSVSLDVPVSIGDYRFPSAVDEPLVVRMERTPCQPGLSARDQQRAGHADLLGTSFETFERKIRDQLGRVLGPGGFDPARDIEAITVNRWPHGYAYEYNPLWDPDWPAGQRPCDIARRTFGRIAIANSDAAAAAYTDQAIDQAYRAVAELAGSTTR
jgi:spermidine dehydrogenase